MTMMKHELVIAMILAGISPAFAGATPWVDVGPDARLRLISNDVVNNGKTLAAIEIDMPAKMKTYWRIPGETGIPTQMDISGSANVTGFDIAWPYPRREKKDGYIDFVYYGPTVLPVELEVGPGDATLQAQIFMGICADICVPVRASFELDLDFAKADRAQDLRIRQTLAEVPLAWDREDAPIGEVRFDAAEHRLDVVINEDIADPGTVIVDNGDPALLFSMPQKSRESGIISFQLLGRGKDGGLHGEALRFTFLTDEGAFELTRTVQSAGARGEGE